MLWSWFDSNGPIVDDRGSVRERLVHPSFRLCNPDLAPRLADVSATANTLEADAAADGRSEVGVTRAYVHWHDPDTVTIHPFKDTPLGDAA